MLSLNLNAVLLSGHSFGPVVMQPRLQDEMCLDIYITVYFGLSFFIFLVYVYKTFKKNILNSK